MFPTSSRQRWVVIVWSLVSGIIHIGWEGSWSLLAPWLAEPWARHGWAQYWTLYGLADARYVHADPFVRILELVTGTIVAALNLGCAWSVLRQRNGRGTAIALLIASVMEVYGTILYFGSEMLNGWRNVDTGSFVHTWLMFFGLNTLWLIFPGWCIYEITSHAIGLRRTVAVESRRGAPAVSPS